MPVYLLAYIYVATEQSSGGQQADGTVLRIEPAP